jgi:hypothetical protein
MASASLVTASPWVFGWSVTMPRSAALGVAPSVSVVVVSVLVSAVPSLVPSASASSFFPGCSVISFIAP